jgi:hypothetical protein
MSDAIATRMDIPGLLEKAVAANASVETLERLFALAKDVRAEQARAAWHEAMAAFQNEAPDIAKTKVAEVQTRTGGAYTYKYAPLDVLISAVRPVLARHGLSVVFKTDVTKEAVRARCLVGHADGHVEECEFTIPIDLTSRMNAAQQVASACTYARRYAYMAALGLSPEDDNDGVDAGDTNGGEPTRQSENSAVRAAAASAAPGEFIIDFGKKWNGKPISAVDNGYLAWLIEASEKDLRDPLKARFKAKTKITLDAALREKQRRAASADAAIDATVVAGDEPPPLTDEDLPFGR